MAIIQIKELKLGEGRPKICIPITDKTLNAMTSSLENMKDAEFDLIEWRADKFEQLSSEDALREARTLILSAFPEKPLIFTIRTNRDMEDFEITEENYASINRFVIQNQLADLVDIELSFGESMIRSMAELAHEFGMYIIASRHYANSTPSKEDMLSTLVQMQNAGADIVKLATMPQNDRDVLNLLDATLSMKEQHPTTPVITMSMGKQGMLSRISGSLTGSCLTFGTVGAASAPGQLDCGKLNDFLHALS